MKSFPDTLPQNCPLDSAVKCEHTVFMAFNKITITSAQCKTQAEKGRALNTSGEGECTRHGLSVFPSVESCQHQINLFPRLGPHIGKAELNDSCGVIAHTGHKRSPKHMTWWSYDHVDRALLFTLVDEGDL